MRRSRTGRREPGIPALHGGEDVNSIESVSLDVADTAVAGRFYAAARGPDVPLRSHPPRRQGALPARCAGGAGVPPEGSGSHRLAIGGDAGSFMDPDGFEWRPAT
jgi:hypothetical protein